MGYPLKLYLFGGFELVDAEGSPVTIPVKKARALLAWLSLQPGTPHSRDKLSTLLWGDSTEQQARHSLRQALTALRKSSDAVASALEASHEMVLLKPGVIRVDALELEAGSERSSGGVLALESLRGDFLEGLSTRSPAFEEWLMDRREHYRALVAQRLEGAMTDAVNNERMSEAVRIGIRLTALEPLREDIHRALMECYAALGRTPAALQQYRICQATLDRELGVAPSAETENVKRRLLSERSRPERASAPPTRAKSPAAPKKPQLRQITLVSAAPMPPGNRDDPEAEGRALAALEQGCRELAGRFGAAAPLPGSHNILIVFGSPRTSSNDSLRALQFSKQLRESTDARIAVASGRAVVSFDEQDHIERISGTLTRQVEAMIHDGGPAGIVISDSVRLSCINHANVNGPLPTNLPGNVKTWSLESVNVHRPIRELPEFVGRRRELNQVTMMLDFCREGDHGHVFMIRGEAGIGKSRLIQRIIEEATGKGDLCIEHHAASPVPVREDNLIVDCLAALISDAPAGEVDADSAGAHLRGFDLDEALINYARALFETGESEFRQSFFASSDIQERQSYGRQLLKEIIEGMGRDRSVLLVIEDIHQAGPFLMQQLAELAGMTTRTRLVLVMTSRFEGEALNPAWRGAMSGAPMTTIDLPPLPLEESRLLAEHLAGSDYPRLDDCVVRSAGNPLFLEQLLLTADIGEDALPDSIQSIVDSRLDELSEDELDAIHGASVLGWRFNTKALCHVLGGREESLDGLMARGLLVVAGNEGRFLHELIHKGIYNSMLADERRAYHGKAAEYYRDIDAYQHASHAIEASPREADSIHRDIVERYIDSYEFEKALSLLERQIRNNPGDHSLLALKARVLQLSGATADALEVYKEALNRESSDEALIGIADALIVLERYDEALHYLDALAKAMDEDPQPEIAARTEILRSRIAFSKGYVDACVEHGTKAAEYAHEAGLVTLEIESLSTMADAQYQQGRMDWALELFDRTWRLAMEHDLQQHAAVNMAMAAWIEFYMLRVEDAERDILKSLELARASGHRRHQAIVLSVLGGLYQYTGNYEGLIDHAQSGAEIARSVGSPRFELECRSLMAYARCMTGEREEGFRELEANARRMVELRPAYAGPWFLAMAARCSPHPGMAADLLREGEEIFARMTCISHNYLHFYDFAIERMLEDSSLGEAARYADTLEDYLKDRNIPFGDLCVRRGRTLIDSAVGKEGANEAVQALTQECRELGLKAMAEFCEGWRNE